MIVVRRNITNNKSYIAMNLLLLLCRPVEDGSLSSNGTRMVCRLQEISQKLSGVRDKAGADGEGNGWRKWRNDNWSAFKRLHGENVSPLEKEKHKHQIKRRLRRGTCCDYGSQLHRGYYHQYINVNGMKYVSIYWLKVWIRMFKKAPRESFCVQ